MKKIIFAICLALLSSNVNARCFKEDDDNYFKCTVFETMKLSANIDDYSTFLYYTFAFTEGVLAKLVDLELNKKIYEINDIIHCGADYDFNSITDNLYNKVRNKEISSEASFYPHLTNEISEHFYNCLQHKQFLNELTEKSSQIANKVIEENHNK